MAYTEFGNEGEFNDTTEVDVVTAPASGAKRIINSIIVSNLDTVGATIHIRKYDGASIQFQWTIELEAGGFATISRPIILDTTSKNIKGVLGGAATANQPTFDAAYGDHS